MRTPRSCPDRPDRQQAQLRLPPLDAAQALLLASTLERATERLHVLVPRLRMADAAWLVHALQRIERAIWRAHGNAMADHLAMLGVETPPPRDAQSVGNDNLPQDPLPGDDNIPF